MQVDHTYLGHKKDVDKIDIQPAEELPDGSVRYKFDMVFKSKDVVPFITDMEYLQNHISDTLKDFIEYLNLNLTNNVLITDKDNETGEGIDEKTVGHLFKQMRETVPRLVLHYGQYFLSARQVKLFENLDMPTYKFTVNVSGDNIQAGIQCLVCGMASFHPEDIKNLYCASCSKFHEKRNHV